MKHRPLSDIDAWVNRTFTPQPKPATSVVRLARIGAPSSKVEKAAENPEPFTPLEDEPAWRGCSPAVRDVIKQVSEISGVPLSKIIRRGRKPENVMARQIAAWLARNFTDRSLPAIASELGGRDHTTIMHAINAIDRSIQEGDIEPEKHTVEGWARALLAYHQVQLRLRAKAFSDMAKARRKHARRETAP
jgi:hypothetical protein